MSNDADQTVAGVGLLVAGYTDASAAGAALDTLKQAKDAGEFAYDDAAVVVRDADGNVHIKESGDMTTGKGAGIGALIGGVIGLIAAFYNVFKVSRQMNRRWEKEDSARE